MNDEAPLDRVSSLVAELPGTRVDDADLAILHGWYQGARSRAGRALDALELGREVADHLVTRRGAGSIATRWAALATIARADLTVARVVEPHLDALDILAQAPSVDLTSIGVDPHSTWGVYAAEAGGMRVDSRDTAVGVTLSGTKPWCSLAHLVTHALVTAHTERASRALYAVELGSEGVSVLDSGWVARGLTEVASGAVTFAGARAVPVGGDGWYLDRPGFAWGGIQVAAIWWGGALALADRLALAAAQREPDQIALAHLGAVDAALHAAGVALSHAASVVDSAESSRAEARILAARTRMIVANAVEEVITRCGHSLGPAPLALDDEHATRVADLTLYVRQHHAERDAAALARALISTGET